MFSIWRLKVRNMYKCVHNAQSPLYSVSGIQTKPVLFIELKASDTMLDI